MENRDIDDRKYLGAGELLVLKSTEDSCTFMFLSKEGQINDWYKYPVFPKDFDETSKRIKTKIEGHSLVIPYYVETMTTERSRSHQQINGLRWTAPYVDKRVRHEELKRALNSYLAAAVYLGLDLQLSGWKTEEKEDMICKAYTTAEEYRVTSIKEQPKVFVRG